MSPTSPLWSADPNDVGPKPKLRGVFHALACLACLPATAALVHVATPGPAMLASWVFMLGLTALFGVSALYHRLAWTEEGLARMRRLDHGTIFLSIASFYTPFCMIALPTTTGQLFLLMLWFGAALGILRVLLWPYAPRGVSVASYMLVSCLAFPVLPQIWSHVSLTADVAILCGYLSAALAAYAYALRRPEPWPGVLGHHEVMHLAVIACASSYYVAVWTLVAHA